MSEIFPSPKLEGTRSSPLPYYAGYSGNFVARISKELAIGAQDTVLDPWNGSGTTTSICRQVAGAVVGFDINPVMVVAARARLLSKSTSSSIGPLAAEILGATASSRSVVLPTDGLLTWFRPRTARRLRRLERAIFRLLVSTTTNPTYEFVDEMSDIASFFYVAFFRLVRSLLGDFRSSNPSWLKTPDDAKELVEANFPEIRATFLAWCKELEPSEQKRKRDCHITLKTADSRSLPLKESSIDFAITSPPYCTRLDYVIATLPERAALGVPIDRRSLKKARDRYLGTPTMTERCEGAEGVEMDFGKTASTFLRRVKIHPSRASSTYYYRFFQQYFTGAHASLRELTRVCRKGAKAALVVQDSNYKDIRLDLSGVWSEIAEKMGWSLTSQIDFRVPNPISRTNPKAMKYRIPAEAIESAMLLELT